MTTLYIITGPTASGKSARAMDLAAQTDGVIVNADSVQVYDTLPILSAQPSAEDFQAAPHKLYGYRHPNEDCSAGNWREDTLHTIREILAEGKTPVIVGGSGLYIKALTEGFSPIPDIPEDVRARAVALQAELGNPAFHAELQKRDPVMAARFHPFHTARLVRAWEVLEATGKSLADWQAIPKELPPAEWMFDITLVMPDKDVLDQRCDARFDWMMQNGAMEEIEAFDAVVTRGDIREDALIHRALGARPLREYLHGHLSKEDAIVRAKTDTRQYAKRQLTWFRHQVRPQKNIAKIEKVS